MRIVLWTNFVKSLTRFAGTELGLSSFVAKTFDILTTLLRKDYISAGILCILWNFSEQHLYTMRLDTTVTYRFLDLVQMEEYNNK